MKIILVVATSQDGFINHIGEKHVYDWSSKEDQKHYAALLKRYKLKLMGLSTYEAYKDNFNLSSPSLRVVFTHHPADYKATPGKLEFTDEPIEAAVERLEAAGNDEAILVGGGILFTEFLAAGLVDEAYQTIEPLTFGEGIPFLTNNHTMRDYPYLALEQSSLMNETGTKLLHYLRDS